MATATSFLIVLLLSSVGSLAAGGNGGDANNNTDKNDNVQRACADTPYPDVCFSNLSPMKESNKANASDLVGMGIFKCTSLLNVASYAASTERLHYDMSEDESLCFRNCTDEFQKASEAFTKSCETSDSGYNCLEAKLDDVRSFLSEAKKRHVPWNCQKCRHGKQQKIVDGISTGNEVEKFIAVLEVLLDHARK